MMQVNREDDLDRRLWIVGWGLPTLLIFAVVFFVPGGTGSVLGISAKSWCLFGCAPLTSLCLFVTHWARTRHQLHREGDSC